MGTAEEEIAGLIRDLVDEAAQARALELSALSGREFPIESEEDMTAALAVFNVRGFGRTQRVGRSGKVVHEEVRPHTANRFGTPGVGMEHPGNFREHFIAGEPGHMGFNISPEEWKANQWKKAQKIHAGIAETRQAARPGAPEKGRAAVSWVRHGYDADKHLDQAQKHLSSATAGGETNPGEHLARAYESLRKAHRIGTERVLPGVYDAKDAKHAHQVLDRIQGHMEDLDKLAGANPARTRQLLAGEREAGIAAGERQIPLSRLSDAIRTTAFDLKHPKAGAPWHRDVTSHLEAATEALHPIRGAEKVGQSGPAAMSEAYHHLHEAHQAGVERVLSRAAEPEDRQAARKGLDRIQAHMEALDKLAGMDTKNTRRLVGTAAEQEARASHAVAQAARAPGARVSDIHRAVQSGALSEHEGGQLLNQAQGRGQTGLEGELKGAEAAQWVGKRVQVPPADLNSVYGAMSRGGQGTVVAVPKDVFDLGSESRHPNGEYGSWAVTVQWDSGGKTDMPLSWLEEHKPEPPKGAQAVHPQLGGHMARLPGDTISSRAYSHVPTPMPQAQPATPSPAEHALDQAHKTIDRYAKQAESRRQSDLSGHLAEIRAKEMEARGQVPPGQYAPLSDEQFAAHVRDLEASIDEALRQGRATEQQHSVDGQGYVWSPDRSLLHADIIKDYMDRQVDVPAQRAALFVGGLPGAGKSSLLRNHPSQDLLKEYAPVNPDDFKAELARRGMIPEVPGLSPLEASALVHEESAYLADLAANALQARGKNLIFDVTMKNEGITADRVRELKRNGYKVSAFLVDVPVEKSADRVVRRYRKGLESYRKGANPLGARYVPRSVVLRGEDAPGHTRPRSTFEKLKPEFARWERWDGTQGLPVRVEQGGPAKVPEDAQGDTIPSAEALRLRLDQPYIGSTEAEAQAREHGAPPS